MSAQQSGYVLGSIVMIGCTLGVLASGWLLDWLQRRGRSDACMRTGVIGAMGVLPPAALLLLIQMRPDASLPAVLTLLAIAFFFCSARRWRCAPARPPPFSIHITSAVLTSWL